MTNRKVVFVYPGDLNTRTGGYRYDKRIVEGLSGKNACWDVHPLSLQGDYPFPTPAQLSAANSQLANIPDHTLTVVDGLAYSAIPTILAKHAARLTLVALIHHPLALETGLTTGQSVKMKALETQALGYARGVITTSELTANSLTQYQVAAHRIHAVLPGTDSAALADGGTGATINLLCIATLTPRKGHGVLLDALKRIEQLPWQLTCVGSTERNKAHAHTLLEQRQRYAFEDRISFLGELNDKAVEQQYHQADVFVLASFHEGYGMVLTEAIARGLPIICSNAGAMPQTVPKGAGIMVPPGDCIALADALSRFLIDEQLRLQLRTAAGHARQQLRSWQNAIDEFSLALEKIDGESTPNRIDK